MLHLPDVLALGMGFRLFLVYIKKLKQKTFPIKQLKNLSVTRKKNLLGESVIFKLLTMTYFLSNLKWQIVFFQIIFVKIWLLFNLQHMRKWGISVYLILSVSL